jgi:hypothetical protein
LPESPTRFDARAVHELLLIFAIALKKRSDSSKELPFCQQKNGQTIYFYFLIDNPRLLALVPDETPSPSKK